MPSGGDIIEITVNHPELGTYSFAPVAGEDSTYNPGGIVNADENASIDAKGRAIYKKNRQRWSFEVTCAWDMQNSGDDEQEMLSKLAANSQEGDWTFTNINGVVHTGKGKPVGEYSYNGNASTFPLKCSGSGILGKIK